MSLDRPHSRASSGGRGPPPTPPPTYLWEELRRSRSRGGYPWTILDKEPLPDFLDSESLIRGEIPEEYVRRSRPKEKKSRYYRRNKDRDRDRRARSEPTPSIPSSSVTDVSLPVIVMDQAVGGRVEDEEEEEFPLADEEIPDFVMAYLQSDKAGNLDEDIPDHILEYIQSRAAVLSSSKGRHQTADPDPDDDLYYTEDELRILDEARRRLEEQGELHPKMGVAEQNHQDSFDQYFNQTAPAAIQQVIPAEEPVVVNPAPSSQKKFNFKGISKPQLNIKLPKFNKKDPAAQEEGSSKKERRPQSASPIRKKITQQLESWNNSLKRFKGRNKNQDGQVKGFVALLPGRSKGNKPKDPVENQYEEVGKQRPELLAIAQDNKNGYVGEETMEDIENLPESEIVESPGLTMIVDREAVDSIQPEFEDIEIDDDEFDDEEEVVPEPAAPPPPSGLAARSRKVLEDTKSKIKTSLSKEQLQLTRNKLKTTKKKVESSTKRNFEATKQNLRATGEKLQTTLTSSLKRNKKPVKEATMVPENIIFPDLPEIEREYETSTPVLEPKVPKNQEEIAPPPEDPPVAKTRTKKKAKKSQSQSTLSCKFVIEEEEEEEEEEEIEPRMEFSIHGLEKPAVSSVSQSTETLPEDEMESEKENVVVRPKRHRYRHRRHGFHEEFARPRSVNSEPDNIRSSWVDSRPSYPSLSREILESFSIPVNSLDGWTSLPGKPERPSRSKHSVSSSEDHFYSNVPPRRTKRKQPSASCSTWPRQHPDASIERPVAPKRLKLKAQNNQTWPRRLDGSNKNTPTAPKRSRSRPKMSKSRSGNILQEADILLGSEARFIDEELNSLKAEQVDPNKPKSNILMDADTLFGSESRFIDDDPNGRKDEDPNRPKSNILVDADTLFGAESRFIDDEEENRILPEGIQYNIQVESAEPKILNRKPSVPVRRNKARTLNRVRPASNKLVDESTWPRASKPSAAPRRNKRSLKSNQLTLDKPSKKLPAVPASTPLNDESAAAADSSSIQAGLDHVLEILANFPQDEPNSSPPNGEQQIIDENPYAEIKQFQQNKPPRPPPPTYVPQSTNSTSSYSYIYTVPRRNKKKSTTISPERPPRTYCTIRPHRPPRKSSKRRSKSETILVTEEIPILSEEDSGRDLQSSPVVQRMRVRPLPPPPRTKRNQSKSPPPKPPRSANSTLKRVNKKEVTPEEIKVTQIETEIIVTDEYEPIENPAAVEEVSIGIQTDPLPDTEEILIQEESVEINNNNVIIEVINVAAHQPVIESPPEEIVWSPMTSRDPEEPKEEEVTLKSEDPEPEEAVQSSQSEEPKEVEQVVWSSATSPDPEEVFSSSKSPYLEAAKRPSIPDEEKKQKKTEEDEEDSFSHMFPRSLPPIRLEMPTHLHLSELDVDRLNVREVTADRLVISSVDASTLQVSQMTSASGQLVFNIGAGVTIPSMPPITTEIPQALPERIEEIRPERIIEETPIEEAPVAANPAGSVTEPSVTDLTLQLVNISSRHVARAAQAVAADAYVMAQRVAEMGLQQVNQQLQRHGIQFDDKEMENIKAVLLMLLIVVAAIFLLGLGKQRISNHWDFYFPN